MPDSTSPSSGAAEAAVPHPYRWAMLAAVWLAYFCFGMVTITLAPLVEPVIRDLGMSHAEMGTVLGAWQMVYIASAVPCGALLDRVGPRRALLMGLGLIAASAALRALADGYASLFLAVAVFGLGGPLISVGAPKLVSLWFAGPERGFAMGAYFTGPVVGNIFTLSLTNSVLMPLFGGDWRSVMLVYVAVVVFGAAVWLAVTGHPASRSMDSRVSNEPRESQVRTFVGMISIPAVRVVLAMSICIFFFNHGLNNWLPEILRAGGMTAAEAGYWASLPALVSIAAALSIPRLATPPRRTGVLLAVFSSAVGASLLLHATAHGVLAVGLVMQGIAAGSMMTLAILTLIDVPSVGARRAGLASGLFFAVAEVGGVLGPVTIGAISEFSGGFGGALGVLTVLCLSLVGLTVLLRHYMR